MGNTASSGKVTPQDRAILQMKMQRDNLANTSKKLTIIMKKETQIAREALSRNDKRTALLALKKKKFQESSINRIQEQLLTLESLINTVEFKLVEKDFVYGLKQGNEILKQLNKELSLEKVDKIMDSSEENVRYQQEVDLELSRNLNRTDELEIDQELQQLIDEQTGPILPQVPKTELLPDVPTHEIKQDGEEEEEEANKRESLLLAA